MPVSPELLALLRCPETMQALSMASPECLARVAREGRAARSGKVAPMEGGLLREDGRLLFPIRDGLPVLLMDEAISLDDHCAPVNQELGAADP